MEVPSDITQRVMKRSVVRAVQAFVALGFIAVIVLIWVNELLDLPALAGAKPTPLNWHEGFIESAVVVLLGGAVLFLIRRYLARIRYLERFIVLCSYCKRVRVGDEWIHVDDYLREHGGTEISHSLCPECCEKHYGGLFKEDE